MTCQLGSASRLKLAGVHPRLVAVVERAIALTPQDFAVTDGVRSLARQKQLVAAGKSKTMQSMHLRQADGFGHAVDLVPWAGGAPRWDWTLIRPVVLTVRQAAIELGVPLVWGSVWDRRLNDLPGDLDGLNAAIEAYKARHPGPDFLDGPHYQMA